MIAPAACAAAGILNLLGRPLEDSGLLRGVAPGVLQVVDAPDHIMLKQSCGDACKCSDLRAGQFQV